MNILPKKSTGKQLARAEMPPLLKGYLNLGATFGNGVSVDIDQNSYVVMVILQTKNIKKSYQKHFTGSENAFDNFVAELNIWRKFIKKLLFPVTGIAAISKHSFEKIKLRFAV